MPHPTLARANAVEQHGPYGVMPGTGTDWYLIYFDDEECIESWDELLSANPQFGQSHQLEAASVIINDRNLLIERWGQQSPMKLVIG